jgi:hypothetical protein
MGSKILFVRMQSWRIELATRGVAPAKSSSSDTLFVKRGTSGWVGAAAAVHGAPAPSSGAASNALRWPQFMPTLAALETGSARLGESNYTAPVPNGPCVLRNISTRH